MRPLQQVRGRDLEILLTYLLDADHAYNLRQPEAPNRWFQVYAYGQAHHNAEDW
jgi:hypothetical protein